MTLITGGKTGNVLFRHDQDMYGGGRVDIVESNKVVVFVDGLRRNLLRGDLAENTIVHDGFVDQCLECRN
jgi:hypothetical protein